MAKTFTFDAADSLAVRDSVGVNPDGTPAVTVWLMNSEQAVRHAPMFRPDMTKAADRAKLDALVAAAKK